MTADDEAEKLGNSLKILAIIFVLFIVSSFKSCAEIKYKFSGKYATADIQQVSKVTSRSKWGISRKKLEVSYSFLDKDGASHVGSFNASESWDIPEDKKINVTYLPSDPNTSIPTEDRSNIYFLIFIAISAIFIGFCVRTWRQVQEDVRVNKRYK